MKSIALALGAVLVLMLAVFGLSYLMESDHARPPLPKPWEITINPDNSTTVLGLTLGHSTLGDAIAQFTGQKNYALIEKSATEATLEMYVERANISGITGKLVLVTTAIPISANTWDKVEAITQDNKHFIRLDKVDAYVTTPLFSITFVPKKNLSPEILTQTFGKADKIIKHDKIEHWLYPKKGVDIALSQDTKDVIQYVLPRDFEQLTAPLY
jgi:hypothetical protein